MRYLEIFFSLCAVLGPMLLFILLFGGIIYWFSSLTERKR